MTTSEQTSTEVNGGGPSAGLLLERIATASLLEAKYSNVTSDGEDDSDEEVFEDGDVNEQQESETEVEVSDNDEGLMGRERVDGRHDSVAAVLTELSQVTSSNSGQITNTNVNTKDNSVTTSPAFLLPSRLLPNPNMAATINSINAFLQSQLLPVPSAQPQKARLYGPIRANVNIRHGVWAPRLRCRKRKNLHAKDGIWINPTCTLEHLIYLVKSVLPDEFEWDPQTSPLRYQAVNDQSLQSLKTVSGTVATGQSLFSAFDLVRNRRSDGDNFILQLYVYGTWTVLLKPNNLVVASYHQSNSPGDEELMSLQPPPKKKYQQAHQMQMNMVTTSEESNSSTSVNQNSGMFHMRLSPPNTSSHGNTTANNTSQTSPFYTHPLSANPPVTFLPTVTLEMKLNGIFVPVEISRRSFVSAIRACSIPKPNNNVTSEANVTSTMTSNVNGTMTSGNVTHVTGTPSPQNTTSNNASNNSSTPPPSDA